ncbi:hypothetical protein TrRE_jg11195, partial [Triparma retinervis]
MPKNQELAKRERSMFSDLMRFYETKQYKKGMKAADTILKKSPAHGETLCMRGLILNCMGKADEAIENVKKGLRENMASHVCWHVYGLVHRSNKNYPEAAKCYKQALRIDPNNMQILRDLSLLQIQTRDYKGFSETRHALLDNKPSARFNWIAFAMGKHLAGDTKSAIAAIDSFLAQVKDKSIDAGDTAREADFAVSEMQMYKNQILMETSSPLALPHLMSIKDVVLDAGSWLHSKGTIELRSGSHASAASTFSAMLERGMTEDYRVHAGYQAAKLSLEGERLAEALEMRGMDTPANKGGLTEEERELLKKRYTEELKTKYGRSHAVNRILMTVLRGDEKEEAMSEYVKRALTKGVPSLGSDLLSMVQGEGGTRIVSPKGMATNETYKVIDKVVGGFARTLSGQGAVWAKYVKVQMMEALGEYEGALSLLEECISGVEDEREGVDLHERKGRILKLMGDLEGACEVLDKARQVDLADRYINNKTTKYLLRAGKVEQAEKTIGLFTRHETNAVNNLFEMQCSWFELEYARAMQESGSIGRALKKFSAVDRHFSDFAEDQFDFHNYCVRKTTLRSYISILRLEDHIWDHDFWARACKGIVDCYLWALENPDLVGGGGGGGG